MRKLHPRSTFMFTVSDRKLKKQGLHCCLHQNIFIALFFLFSLPVYWQHLYSVWKNIIFTPLCCCSPMQLYLLFLQKQHGNHCWPQPTNSSQTHLPLPQVSWGSWTVQTLRGKKSYYRYVKLVNLLLFIP